ncbi:class IV adenylate cyclase [Halorussus halophilus]|uniref:class IV adenylate cyclase n=1 Tax=Halorussus halophilus TaxID=2650975 RepID=UPI001300E807|nr:class IV adenylate cyclase [Halorussus halophilus]
MYEVEVKVRADHAAVREQLDAQNATPVDHVTQIDTYYSAPHRDFAETDEALRIREETPRESNSFTEVTYKGPLADAKSKTRREIETVVECADDMGAILEALDFEPAAEVRKERERFALDGYTVTLDSVEGLGEFVEVETEAEDIDPAREGAFDVLRSLGLDPDDQIQTSYLGLLLASDE